MNSIHGLRGVSGSVVLEELPETTLQELSTPDTLRDDLHDDFRVLGLTRSINGHGLSEGLAYQYYMDSLVDAAKRDHLMDAPHAVLSSVVLEELNGSRT